MLEKVVGVGVVRRWLYLAVKPPQVGVDADRISYPVHHLSAFGCQPGVHNSWFQIVLPYFIAKPFLRDSLPPWAHRLRLSGWGPEPLGMRHLI
jgi:hypothetical protein